MLHAGYHKLSPKAFYNVQNKYLIPDRPTFESVCTKNVQDLLSQKYVPNPYSNLTFNLSKFRARWNEKKKA